MTKNKTFGTVFLTPMVLTWRGAVFDYPSVPQRRFYLRVEYRVLFFWRQGVSPVFQDIRLGPLAFTQPKIGRRINAIPRLVWALGINKTPSVMT